MSVDVTGLVRKAEQFLNTARLLRAQGDYDSTASRLYYAMFHCAQALLATKGLRFSRHCGVISAFGEHFVKTGELPVPMSAALREGFELRHTGDYESLSVEAAAVQDLEAKADEFVRLARAYLAVRGLI